MRTLNNSQGRTQPQLRLLSAIPPSLADVEANDHLLLFIRRAPRLRLRLQRRPAAPSDGPFPHPELLTNHCIDRLASEIWRTSDGRCRTGQLGFTLRPTDPKLAQRPVLAPLPKFIGNLDVYRLP